VVEALVDDWALDLDFESRQTILLSFIRTTYGDASHEE
jgi:hypothetical protein